MMTPPPDELDELDELVTKMLPPFPPEPLVDPEPPVLEVVRHPSVKGSSTHGSGPIGDSGLHAMSAATAVISPAIPRTTRLGRFMINLHPWRRRTQAKRDMRA
jgi:hypothetical protein